MGSNTFYLKPCDNTTIALSLPCSSTLSRDNTKWQHCYAEVVLSPTALQKLSLLGLQCRIFYADTELKCPISGLEI